jgi:hypothetical protein
LQNSIKDFPSPAEFVDFIKSVQCPTGSYRVDELIQMNGDSVQLYVCTAVRNEQRPDELDAQEEHEVGVHETETEPAVGEEQTDTVDEDEAVEEVATEDAAAEEVDDETAMATDEESKEQQHEEEPEANMV